MTTLERTASAPGCLTMQDAGIKQLSRSTRQHPPRPVNVVLKRTLFRELNDAAKAIPRPNAPSRSSASSVSSSSSSTSMTTPDALMKMLAEVDAKVHSGVQQFPAFVGASEDLYLQISIASVWFNFLSDLVKNTTEESVINSMEKVRLAIERMQLGAPSLMNQLNQYSFEYEDSLADDRTSSSAMLVDSRYYDDVIKVLIEQSNVAKAENVVLRETMSADCQVDVFITTNTIEHLYGECERKDKKIADLERMNEVLKQEMEVIELSTMEYVAGLEQRVKEQVAMLERVGSCVTSMNLAFDELKSLFPCNP